MTSSTMGTKFSLFYLLQKCSDTAATKKVDNCLTCPDASENPRMGVAYTGFKALTLETFSYCSSINFCKGERIWGKNVLYLTFYQLSN